MKSGVQGEDVPSLCQLRVPQLHLSLHAPLPHTLVLLRSIHQSAEPKRKDVDCECCQLFQRAGQPPIAAHVPGRVNLGKDHQDPYPGQVSLVWEPPWIPDSMHPAGNSSCCSAPLPRLYSVLQKENVFNGKIETFLTEVESDSF